MVAMSFWKPGDPVDRNARIVVLPRDETIGHVYWEHDAQGRPIYEEPFPMISRPDTKRIANVIHEGTVKQCHLSDSVWRKLQEIAAMKPTRWQRIKAFFRRLPGRLASILHWKRDGG